MYLAAEVSVGSSITQLVSVLLIFVFVLAIAYWTTKWIAGFQKEKTGNGNIEVIETERIAQNKFIQIVRIGKKYYALSICKDTVTYIGEIKEDELITETASKDNFSFKDFFNKAREQEKE